MDDMHKKGKSPKEILAKLQRDRARHGDDGPGSSAVYNFLAGVTHRRDASETRGRPSQLPRRLVSTAVRVRKHLIQKAKNEYVVTWEDVHAATKVELKRLGLLGRGTKMPSEDWLGRLVRDASEVRARPPKRRISRTKDHEKQRYETSSKWRKYPQRFWYNGVHCYLDNKKFVIARTALQKKLLRSTRIHHHLRTPSEGGLPGFVVPKRAKMLLGVPSVEITAGVAKNKIIFWYINENKWCGKQAAKMYAALGKTLRKTYGNLKSFTVVEDGDTKGYKSNLGKAAKGKEKIKTMDLPPRSPGMMPLDYTLWDEIEHRALAKHIPRDETDEEYLKRLRTVALRLPKSLVENTIRKMKDNIEATYDSEGGTTIAKGGLD